MKYVHQHIIESDTFEIPLLQRLKVDLGLLSVQCTNFIPLSFSTDVQASSSSATISPPLLIYLRFSQVSLSRGL